MKSPVSQYTLPMPLAEAETAVRQAFQEQGFGILTEIDVAATLRAKLGVETKPHRILGACNPRLAHASLTAEPDVAAFLPCGVALREGQTAGETVVVIQDPQLLAAAFAAPALVDIAKEAATRLEAAMATLEGRA